MFELEATTSLITTVFLSKNYKDYYYREELSNFLRTLVSSFVERKHHKYLLTTVMHHLFERVILIGCI